MSELNNIFNSPQLNSGDEIFNSILNSDSLKIERIVSKGNTSPDEGWYEQESAEWVVVLEGEGHILYEDGREFKLKKGNHLNIPARTKHKVSWTDPNGETIWLAVHY